MRPNTISIANPQDFDENGEFVAPLNKRVEASCTGIRTKFVASTDDFEKPAKIVVRALSLTKENHTFTLAYSGALLKNSQHYKKRPKDKAELKTLLGHFKNSNFVDQKPPEKPNQPSKNESPLSINCDKKTLVIITLPEDSNIEFNAIGAPISAPDHEIHHFGYVGKVDANGTIHNSSSIFPTGTMVTPVKGCKSAFFVVAPGDHDGIAFNIHLDLVGKIDGNEYRIPIIVDPDVRHPGGGTDP